MDFQQTVIYTIIDIAHTKNVDSPKLQSQQIDNPGYSFYFCLIPSCIFQHKAKRYKDEFLSYDQKRLSSSFQMISNGHANNKVSRSGLPPTHCKAKNNSGWCKIIRGEIRYI